MQFKLHVINLLRMRNVFFLKIFYVKAYLKHINPNVLKSIYNFLKKKKFELF